MCTLIVCWRRWQEPWLLVAVNRDERLDRPSVPPAPWEGRRPALLAPRDLQAGGSWWGCNAAGLFAALTNRFGPLPPDPGKMSRGLLLLEVLQHVSAASAADRLYSLEPASVNRFHLLLCDRQQAFLFIHDGQIISRRRLRPGIQIVTERSFAAGSDERAEFLRREIRLWRRPPRTEALRRLLSRHGPDPFAGTCVHAPAFAYGTRSSSLLRLGRRSRLLHAEGPPCRQAYTDYTPLLSSLVAG